MTDKCTPTVYEDYMIWHNELGQISREDGLPAVECPEGNEYYVDDKRHNTNGPAIEWSDGRKSYFINDEELTYEQWRAATRPHAPRKNAKWFSRKRKGNTMKNIQIATENIILVGLCLFIATSIWHGEFVFNRQMATILFVTWLSLIHI